jgi:hypothetical protein
MSSTEVETTGARPLSVAEERYRVGDASPQAISDSIARRILEADDEDEVFGGIEKTMAEGLDSIEDLLYEPLIVHDVTYAPSTQPGQTAFGIYLVSRAKPVGMTLAQAVKQNAACEWESEGTPFPASCGASNVMAAIEWAREREKLPKAIQVVLAENETAAGFRPFWPRAIDSRHPLTPKPAKLAKRDRSAAPEGSDEPFPQ